MIQPIIDSLLENFQIAYNLHSTAVTDSHTKASRHASTTSDEPKKRKQPHVDLETRDISL